MTTGKESGQYAGDIMTTRAILFGSILISAIIFCYILFYEPSTMQNLDSPLFFLMVFAAGAFASAVRGLDSLDQLEAEGKYNPEYKWRNWRRPLMGGLFALITYAVLRAGIPVIKWTGGQPPSNPWFYIGIPVLLSYYSHLFSNRFKGIGNAIGIWKTNA